MKESLTARQAVIHDLRAIIGLYLEDELGKTREHLSSDIDNDYLLAFEEITKDPNQYLMVVLYNEEIVGTCHLTIMSSLTFKGSTRLQIEAVHVAKMYQNKKVGEWMMLQAIEYGKSKNALIVQLTTNKKRTRAKHFYERLGFVATHEGMKLYLG